MNHNPFVYGNQVSSNDFYDRREPIRQVVRRLLNKGQSTAIIGEPRTGKTSLLCYLAAPEKRAELYGVDDKSLLFQYLDAQMLGVNFSPSDFWKKALEPVVGDVIERDSDSAISLQYALCHDNHFGTFTLETLFRQLKRANLQLVLLLDEFDVLINHPVLNSAEFFGGLRSLASRSDGALALIVGSRLPISQLNTRAQEFKSTGSPYFNIFYEVILGPFPDKDITDLLNCAGESFTVLDKKAIRAAAGGHPFLLQAAAAAMWEAHVEGLTDSRSRCNEMATSLYAGNKSFFADTWRTWSAPTRKAFTAVALAHTAHLLPQRKFLTNAFIEDMRDFGPELYDLSTIGLLAQDEQVRGGWRIVPEAMLWWLADELVRAVRRNDASFEDWLRAQDLEHLLTNQEREQLGKIVQGIAKVLREGATTLMEAFAKGLGASLTGKS